LAELQRYHVLAINAREAERWRREMGLERRQVVYVTGLRDLHGYGHITAVMQDRGGLQIPNNGFWEYLRFLEVSGRLTWWKGPDA
jgi:hypothetical protein